VDEGIGKGKEEIVKAGGDVAWIRMLNFPRVDAISAACWFRQPHRPSNLPEHSKAASETAGKLTRSGRATKNCGLLRYAGRSGQRA
jgi:hypothetical protein